MPFSINRLKKLVALEDVLFILASAAGLIIALVSYKAGSETFAEEFVNYPAGKQLLITLLPASPLFLWTVWHPESAKKILAVCVYPAVSLLGIVLTVALIQSIPFTLEFLFALNMPPILAPIVVVGLIGTGFFITIMPIGYLASALFSEFNEEGKGGDAHLRELRAQDPSER